MQQITKERLYLNGYRDGYEKGWINAMHELKLEINRRLKIEPKKDRNKQIQIKDYH